MGGRRGGLGFGQSDREEAFIKYLAARLSFRERRTIIHTKLHIHKYNFGPYKAVACERASGVS